MFDLDSKIFSLLQFQITFPSSYPLKLWDDSGVDSTQAENLNQRQTSAEIKHYASQIRLAINGIDTGQLDRVDCNITQRVHQEFHLDTVFGIKKLFETSLITLIEYSKSKQTVLFLAKIDVLNLSAFLPSNHSFRSIHSLAQKARTIIGKFFSLNCDFLL